MRKGWAMALLAGLVASPATAQQALEVKMEGLKLRGEMDERLAYCVPKGVVPSVPEGRNLNPTLRWSGAPAGTQSFVVLMADTEVPVDMSNAGKDGLIISDRAPRQVFFHWVLVDLPGDLTRLEEGDFSKDGEPIPYGRHGVNDYPRFMGKPLSEQTLAEHQNYDGPCPPWNDERLHRYHFRVYALDVPTLETLTQPFTAPDVIDAMDGHVLAEGEVVGNYTLNTRLLFQ